MPRGSEGVFCEHTDLLEHTCKVVFADSLLFEDVFYNSAAFVFSLKKAERMSISIKYGKD